MEGKLYEAEGSTLIQTGVELTQILPPMALWIQTGHIIACGSISRRNPTLAPQSHSPWLASSSVSVTLPTKAYTQPMITATGHAGHQFLRQTHRLPRGLESPQRHARPTHLYRVSVGLDVRANHVGWLFRNRVLVTLWSLVCVQSAFFVLQPCRSAGKLCPP
jgi:hypothetical protein